MDRDAVLASLQNGGIIPSPFYREVELLEKMKQISSIGRSWKRTIGDIKIEGDYLEFSHQTIFDYMVPMIYLNKGMSLADFINQFPPFPFLRPFIRTFIFRLRFHSPRLFRQQIIETLKDTGIAYHLKRLIVESLAEIIPTNDDWHLIYKIYNEWPDLLFSRFFQKITGAKWFDLLHDNWLPIIENNKRVEII